MSGLFGRKSGTVLAEAPPASLPQPMPAETFERTVREEVFKEYWAVLQRIEKA